MSDFFLKTIGIICAMPEEANSILEAMTDQQTFQIGKYEFIRGNFEGASVVFSLAGIGKVSAAITATLLIDKFQVDELIFTGIARGSGHSQIGDVVIGNTFLQHGMDLRPIFPQFYIYGLDAEILQADQERVLKMKAAANRFLSKNITFPEFDIFAPKVHEGSITRGNQLIGNKPQPILDQTKDVLQEDFQAVELEGAAVAQVCTELEVPFITVSIPWVS